jgi:hypothetical protein
MTSLNKSIANSPDGNILSMKEYWELIESSVFTQQAETGSYDPIKVVTSKEATPVTGNLTFQVSPGSKFSVNDLHNAYLRLDVERKFIYTNSGAGALAADTITFVGDKHAANFIKQFRICCNDNTITENFDFVYETNILGATIPDSIKTSKPETYTPISSLNPVGDTTLNIIDKERPACGQYVNFRALNNNTTVSLTYFITITMSTFNIFDKLRYLPTFFGNWTLDIVPTLDNMIMKVIDYNNVNQYTCTDVAKQAAFQRYVVGTPYVFTTASNNAPVV